MKIWYDFVTNYVFRLLFILLFKYVLIRDFVSIYYLFCI